MAELATIARPYAEALFKACTAHAGADLDSAVVWVDELAAIAANPQLRQLADNPKVTDS
ncbi:F0F1 ATP synthase subunit delta, partial [Bacillus sp. SRB_336]